jgi:MFS transporter, FHS family, Na+ dependent glucose transporter 1
MGPSLPSLAAQVGVTIGAASILFSMRSLGYMLGSFQAGRLVDRLPGNLLLAGVLVVSAVLLALVPLIPALWLLAAILLMLGAAEGMIDLVCNTLLVWVHGSRVGPYMNALHFFFGIGSFIAPVVIARSLLHDGTLRWGYLALALVVLPAAAWHVRLPAPKHAHTESAAQVHQARPLLIVIIASLLFLYVGAEVSFGGWIYTYSLQQMKNTLAPGAGQAALESAAALLTSAFWGAFTAGRLLGIPVAARFSARAILLVDIAGSLGALALLLAFPASTAVLWGGTLAAGLFLASIFPVILTVAENSMPITGSETRWFFAAVGAGGMFFPWLIGQLFVPVGPQATMLVILSSLVLEMGAYLLLMAYLRREVS